MRRGRGTWAFSGSMLVVTILVVSTECTRLQVRQAYTSTGMLAFVCVRVQSAVLILAMKIEDQQEIMLFLPLR
jgi:hypothetical protein